MLQDDESGIPRLGEAIAYALREALVGILQTQDQGYGGEWKRISRDVVESKERYQHANTTAADSS